MRSYSCCWCGKRTDKGILDKPEAKGCCCKKFGIKVDKTKLEEQNMSEENEIMSILWI